MPNVRLGWTVKTDQFVWGAVSRAVRAPARLDRAVTDPLGGVVRGGPDFISEVATVYQVGYRTQLANVVTWSATGYLHQWDRLRSGSAPPVVIENRIEGPTYGLETWAAWEPVKVWRLSAGLATLRKELRLEPRSTDPVGVANPQLANDPGHQWSIRSSLTPRTGHELDAIVRRVDDLPITSVPAYTAVDARYAWQMAPQVQIAIVGRNLFDERHPEFNAPATRSEFERSIFLQLRWTR